MRVLFKTGDFIKASNKSYTILKVDKYPKPFYTCVCIETTAKDRAELQKIVQVRHEDITTRYVEYDEIVHYHERMTEFIKKGLMAEEAQDKHKVLKEIANLLGLDMDTFPN